MKKGALILLFCTLLMMVPVQANMQSQTVAHPTTVKVIVNGSEIRFDSYTINERTYFKLRDIAFCISNSERQFDVIWNEESRKIHIIPGQPYTAVGGEMDRGDALINHANKGAEGFYISEEWFEISAYEIDWNNYYSIRMLGELLNFEVYWDEYKSTVVVDSNKDYTGVPQKIETVFYAQYPDIPDAGAIFERDVSINGKENIDDTETVYYGYTDVSQLQHTEYQNKLLGLGFRPIPYEVKKISMYVNNTGRVIYTAYDEEKSFCAIYILE